MQLRYGAHLPLFPKAKKVRDCIGLRKAGFFTKALLVEFSYQLDRLAVCSSYG
jgi:hypothetical protein